MIRLEDRQALAQHIEEARAAGARLETACEVAGINPTTSASYGCPLSVAFCRRCSDLKITVMAEGMGPLPEGRNTTVSVSAKVC